MRLRTCIGLLLIGASCGGEALAASPQLPDALRACTQERDNSRRLSCYDREMAQLPATPSESFGLSVEQVRKLRSPGAGDDVRPQVLSSVVTALSARADGRHVIALANGQIWVQGEAWEVLHLSVGDAVTVKPGVLGSYYLRAPSGSATRVTRAQ